MSYESRTQEEILAELQDWSATPASLIEGTFENDVLATNAIEFQKIELELEELYQASFGQTSWGDYLSIRAAESGVIRRAANKAVGTLEVFGTGTVYAGSIFATDAGTRFSANSTTEITGSGIIEITAVDGGASGNVAANTITKIPLSIAGITACNNPAATYDGYDEEDDETLRERYLLKVQQPATSGNPAEYTNWALEVVGVGAAKCVRTWRGAGTVKVIIIDSNFQQANDLLIQRVREHIDSLRPVGIVDGEVTVVSANQRIINISAQILGSIDEVAFREGVTDYFLRIIKKSLLPQSQNKLEVSIHQVESIIVVEGGADDFRNCKLNDERKNVTLEFEDMPILGEVNFK